MEAFCIRARNPLYTEKINLLTCVVGKAKACYFVYIQCIGGIVYGETALYKKFVRRNSTEIPTIIDPSATINYPSATGSINVGISV